MNTQKTIESLKNTLGEKEELYETYAKDDYVIYIASLHQYNKFLIYCANDKLKFPQVALYTQLLYNNIAMCNLCISSGCKMDQKCISFACLLNEPDLISYCLKYGAKPSEQDLEWIIKKLNNKDFDEFSISLLDENTHFNNFAGLISGEINSFGGYNYGYNYYYNNKTVKKDIINWAKEKYGIKENQYLRRSDRKKIVENINKEKAKCIGIIKKAGIEIPANIYKLCTDNNIKLDTEFLSANEKDNYMESLCDKYYYTLSDSKNIIKEIKKYSKEKNKLSDKCYENLMNKKNNIIITHILDNEKDKGSFPDENNLKKLLQYAFEKGNDIMMIKLLNFEQNTVKYEKNILKECLEYACARNLVDLVDVLINKQNMKLDDTCKQKIINANSLIKYLVDNKLAKIDLI
jgi:hypothetical protein